MEAISKALLAIHVFAGFISLVVFWIPIFLKKGSNLHVKIGKVYIFLMWVVVITSAILSVKNFYIGHTMPAIFLGFIALITANPLWYGIAILKNKKGISASYRNKHMVFSSVIFLAGVGLLGYGIYFKGEGENVIMIFFGILGILTGKDVFEMYKTPEKKSNRISEHISGMLISGIAAYTAFAVFGGRTFFAEYFQGYWQVLPWTLPTVLGMIGITYYKKSYLGKKRVPVKPEY